jgi:hypothetical protein
MKEYLKKKRNGAINRLCALYGYAGIIDVTKKYLKDAGGWSARHGELPEELKGQADLPEEQPVLFERQPEGMREQAAERVRGLRRAWIVRGWGLARGRRVFMRGWRWGGRVNFNQGPHKRHEPVLAFGFVHGIRAVRGSSKKAGGLHEFSRIKRYVLNTPYSSMEIIFYNNIAFG